ncbi:MAG: hypothetical protein AAFY72_10020 [Cyanobacteria bacterium J06649_4]
MAQLTCRRRKSDVAQKILLAVGTTVLSFSSATPSQANPFSSVNDFKAIPPTKPAAWLEGTQPLSPTQTLSPTQNEATELRHTQAALDLPSNTSPSATSPNTEFSPSTGQPEPPGWARLRERLLSAPSSTTPTATPLPTNGTYLYGQQPIAGQPATTYFVFEAQGEQVSGAFFMPSSSFDCVQGQINGQHMSLAITDSYSQETYAYTLSINTASTHVASQRNIATPLNIDGFHPMPITESDRTILATCQANS